ncbi:MAG: hypothetical protein OXD41_05845 [Thaumarchaeota archaeon]|nr:hypothetical protein [Nitrososphaerota archaeon]
MAGTHDGIAAVLSREAGLDAAQARTYVLIATGGAMDAARVAGELGIGEDEALAAARALVALGGLIDYGNGRFESMHPRFAAVNMYRKSCEAAGREPSRNDAIDGVGASLEGEYDRARDKRGTRGGGAR